MRGERGGGRGEEGGERREGRGGRGEEGGRRDSRSTSHVRENRILCFLQRGEGGGGGIQEALVTASFSSPRESLNLVGGKRVIERESTLQPLRVKSVILKNSYTHPGKAEGERQERKGGGGWGGEGRRGEGRGGDEREREKGGVGDGNDVYSSQYGKYRFSKPQSM